MSKFSLYFSRLSHMLLGSPVETGDDHPLPVTGSLSVAGSGTAVAPSANTVSTHLGNFQQKTITVDLSLDTNAYGAGDVLAATQPVVLLDPAPAAGLRGEIVGFTVLDKDDQGVAMDVVFLGANTSIGAENGAPDPDDTEGQDVLAVERVSTYSDLGGFKFARPDIAPIPFGVAAGTLWVAAITQGTPTHTAAGIRLGITVRLHNAALLA